MTRSVIFLQWCWACLLNNEINNSLQIRSNRRILYLSQACPARGWTRTPWQCTACSVILLFCGLQARKKKINFYWPFLAMIREAHNSLLSSHDYLHLKLERVRFMRLQLVASSAIILLLISLAYVTSSPNWSKKSISDYIINDLPGLNSTINFKQYSG